MSLMNWTDSLSVNIREIDDQHKKLVGMLNELHDAMKAGQGAKVTGSVLTELIKYVGTHFATEEKYFKQYAYPDSAKHKAEHDDLTKKALDLQKQFQDGKPVLTVELLNFLKNWLTNHIMGTDKKYGPYLNSKGLV